MFSLLESFHCILLKKKRVVFYLFCVNLFIFIHILDFCLSFRKGRLTFDPYARETGEEYFDSLPLSDDENNEEY